MQIQESKKRKALEEISNVAPSSLAGHAPVFKQNKTDLTGSFFKFQYIFLLNIHYHYRLSMTQAGIKYTVLQRETDPHKVEMRLKQIQFGKNTTGYDNYIATIPM
jgi:hypothetical protein